MADNVLWAHCLVVVIAADIIRDVRRSSYFAIGDNTRVHLVPEVEYSILQA